MLQLLFSIVMSIAIYVAVGAGSYASAAFLFALMVGVLLSGIYIQLEISNSEKS